MNLQATQPHESKPDGAANAPSSAAAATGRFTYASGARPLPGYTIKRGIGHGGFGEVYYATSDAGKEVALKLIRHNWDVELRGVTQCLNLKHPNLLALYDVKQDAQGDNWVVMELMSGESLEEVLARNPNGLHLPETLAWIHGIAAGVAYLHDHGIVHRDLKPGNIFVDEGIVKIGDYGLSKFMSCSRRSGQTGSVGTVHYMAPEIANGRYGKEIDIYALGIILYEMLTGHVPFEGESVGEILMKHLTAEPDLSRLDEPYRTIISRLLAKDPQQRFSTVHELIDMLPPVPAGAALTAGARFAGPAIAMGERPAANAGAAIGGAAVQSTGFSLAPEIAGANATQPAPAAGSAKVQPTAPEDPVARWARETKSDFSAWWKRKNFKPWQKLLILGAGLYVLFFFAESSAGLIEQGRTRTTFGEFLLVVGVIYWLYRKNQAKKAAGSSSQKTAPPIFQMTYGANQPNATAPAPENAQQPASANATLRVSPTRRRWQKISDTPLYTPGTPRERFTQLLGSMLLAALACLVVGLVVMILRGETPDPVQFMWLASSAVLGSWAVLVPAKFWEGRRGDPVLRRFVMLIIGLVYAVASFGLAAWLAVPLHFDSRMGDIPATALVNNFFDSIGSPRMVAFLAYFGFLFVFVRWWRLADPLRSTRLSIWHTAVTLFCAFLIGLFWPFPQPWGWMLTVTIAIAVQLASPWLTVAERAKLPRPLPEMNP
ncbi:MAG TPA: serine/threonine-protein kinase [Pirellulales bacterium]|nr:serine/threonine-protein kinase [Pirellulales bacterium]